MEGVSVFRRADFNQIVLFRTGSIGRSEEQHGTNLVEILVMPSDCIFLPFLSSFVISAAL